MQISETATTRRRNSSWPDNTTSRSWGPVGRVSLVRPTSHVSSTRTDFPNRWASLPRLEAEWHPRKQRGVVYRVRTALIPGRYRDSNLKLGPYSASKEEPTAKKHMIVPDGYNIGRNWFVEKATAGSDWRGTWWKADVEWREGLLEPGKHGERAPPQPHSFR